MGTGMPASAAGLPASPGAPRIVKLGGRLLHDPAALAALAQAVGRLREPVVVVHGGGDAVGALQARLGLPIAKVDGLRVTTAAGLDVVVMVLAGLVNTRVVAAFGAAGIDALGVSGVDRGCIACRRMAHPGGDLGFVGEVVAVRADIVRDWLAAGVTPVVAPLGIDASGQVYNVNADDAAAAIARALAAAAVDLVSDVPGVMVDGRVAPRLGAADAERLIAAGTIHGGMVPKVRAALGAVASGVRSARIVDPAGLAVGGGTVLVAEAVEAMRVTRAAADAGSRPGWAAAADAGARPTPAPAVDAVTRPTPATTDGVTTPSAPAPAEEATS